MPEDVSRRCAECTPVLDAERKQVTIETGYCYIFVGNRLRLLLLLLMMMMRMFNDCEAPLKRICHNKNVEQMFVDQSRDANAVHEIFDEGAHAVESDESFADNSTSTLDFMGLPFCARSYCLE
jgi:hypothetical protein